MFMDAGEEVWGETPKYNGETEGMAYARKDNGAEWYMMKACLLYTSGKSFGYEKPVAGEVVFNTAMTGYPESLTDPSDAGQLMTLTYPCLLYTSRCV